MNKKPKKASKRKRLKVKEKPMFQKIIDALKDCHQHIIKAPLVKEQISDMESMILKSANAYMDEQISEIWCLFGEDMKKMMIKDALSSHYSD